MPVAAIPHGLNQFQNLLKGTWTNQPLPNAPNGEGGKDTPLSYNVMPLPQDPPGYILKNFTYFETVRFEGNADVARPHRKWTATDQTSVHPRPVRLRWKW